jgi:hypothetical protein
MPLPFIAAGLARLAPFISRIPGASSLYGGGSQTIAPGFRAIGKTVHNLSGFGLPGPAGTAARAFTSFSLGTAALGGAKGLLSGGGQGQFEGQTFPLAAAQQGYQGGGMTSQAIAPGVVVPKDIIVKTWTTNPALGYPVFGITADGRGVVQKKDGQIKYFRFAKNIVIPRNPRVRNLVRATNRLDKLTAGLVKAPVKMKRAKARVKTTRRKRS